MNVEVYYEGELRESISYSVIPALRLFCLQYGFQFRWDPKRKRIDLDSGLRGKMCLLVAGGAEEGAGLEQEVLSLVETFLSGFGADVRIHQDRSKVPAAHDGALRFTVKEVRSLEEPRLVLFQGENERRRVLLNNVFQELKLAGIPCHIRMSRVQKTSAVLPIQWHIPSGMEDSEKKELAEKIAFYLASGILYFFQNGQQINPISYLPSQIVNKLFGQMTRLEKELEATEPREATEPTEQTEQTPQSELIIESVAPAEMELTSYPSAKQIEPALRLMPVPVETEKRLEAEVYFDYTLMHSDTEDRPYLLVGSLFVKNTGTELLYNPIVCLRVSPLHGIRLGGQILPPNMLETLGVQSSAGIKGWRYLDDDWFTQAQERGEYWIAPIQPMMIPPKMSESFQNFQISLLKQEARTTVTVEGIVLFNDQQIQFTTSNRIAVSY